MYVYYPSYIWIVVYYTYIVHASIYSYLEKKVYSPSQARFPHQILGSWILGVMGLFVSLSCCESMSFHMSAPTPIHYPWRGNGYCDVCMYVGWIMRTMASAWASWWPAWRFPSAWAWRTTTADCYAFPRKSSKGWVERIRTCIHTYIHLLLTNCISWTYVHTCIHTAYPALIHTYIHTNTTNQHTHIIAIIYSHTYIHTYIWICYNCVCFRVSGAPRYPRKRQSGRRHSVGPAAQLQLQLHFHLKIRLRQCRWTWRGQWQ